MSSAEAVKAPNMDERQLIVCAIALFCDGYSPRQVSEALGVSIERARELTAAGSDAQATSQMGYMKSHPRIGPWGRDPEWLKENEV
jgi:transposase